MTVQNWLKDRGIKILAPKTLEDGEINPRWLAERKKGLTATDLPVLMGMNSWKTPLEVYMSKKGLKDDEVVDNDRVWFGNVAEQPMAARFSAETGLLIEKADHLICRKNKGAPGFKKWVPFQLIQDWLRVTPDYYVTDTEGNILGPLEIKTTGMRDHWTEGTPDYVRAQIMAQMAVLGLERAWIAVLTFGYSGIDRWQWDEILWDGEMWAEMEAIGTRFMARIAEERPPDARGDDVGNVREMYPRETGGLAELPAEWVERDVRRQELSAIIKCAQDEKKDLDAGLMQAIGDASHGVLPNGVSYSFKTTDRKSYMVDAKSFRQLRRKKAK